MTIASLLQIFPFGNPAQKGYFLYRKVPPAVLKNLELANFRKTLQFVAGHSPFYRKKFEALRINPYKVKFPSDLGDFFTTAEDIRESPEDFVCLAPDTAFETTGTTSKRTKRVYFSRTEVAEAGWAGAVGLWGVGVRPQDRVASAFDYSFWVSGPVLQAACQALGCFHVEAGRIDPREFYERLRDYGLTVLVGDPSWLLRLSEIVKEKGPWPKPVRLILGGGENMTENARRFIENAWGATCLLEYGQTEAFGAIGMESLAKDGYHLNEFHNYFEIVDRDSQGYGELVYTNLNRRVMPLVRYRSGDITRFLAGTTKGGLPGKRIEKLRGRVDEWTATAMGNLAPWMFEDVLGSVAGISTDWQIVVDKENIKDHIYFCVESQNGRSPSEIEKDIFSGVQRSLPDAWRSFEQGMFKMDVQIVPQGALRQGRKFKRLVDKRIFL